MGSRRSQAAGAQAFQAFTRHQASTGIRKPPDHDHKPPASTIRMLDKTLTPQRCGEQRMSIMDVILATYGQPLVMETEHMEVARIPDIIASMIASRLGDPYQTGANMRRWSASFTIPASRRNAPPLVIPFELVTCSRGASFRCRWDDVAVIHEIIGAMVPDVIVVAVPQLTVPMR